MRVRWLPLRNLISRKNSGMRPEGRQSYEATARGAAQLRRNSKEKSERHNMRLPHLLRRAQSAILTHCGVEQLVARRAHNPEVAGSSPAPATSRVVANSSPRQTHERRVLREGASFAFCAAFLRCGPGRLVPRCLGVLTAGSPGSPSGRPNGPKVSPGLSPGRVLG